MQLVEITPVQNAGVEEAHVYSSRFTLYLRGYFHTLCVPVGGKFAPYLKTV